MDKPESSMIITNILLQCGKTYLIEMRFRENGVSIPILPQPNILWICCRKDPSKVK